jgi:hypothetical protein
MPVKMVTKNTINAERRPVKIIWFITPWRWADFPLNGPIIIQYKIADKRLSTPLTFLTKLIVFSPILLIIKNYSGLPRVYQKFRKVYAV